MSLHEDTHSYPCTVHVRVSCRRMFVLVDSCQGCFSSSVWILCQTSLLSAAVESCGGARLCPGGAIWVSRHETVPKLRWQIQTPYWDPAALPKTPAGVYLGARRQQRTSSPLLSIWGKYCTHKAQWHQTWIQGERHCPGLKLDETFLLFILIVSLCLQWVWLVSEEVIFSTSQSFDLASRGQQCILYMAQSMIACEEITYTKSKPIQQKLQS